MFTISYQIGSAEPVTFAVDIANAKAAAALTRYAQYQGIVTEGKTTRQIAEALARNHARAIMEGAREVYLREKRDEAEATILAQADADSPVVEIVEPEA